MKIKEPGQEVWNKFWKSKTNLKKVYPSSPTVLKTILEKFPVKGQKIMEVGAGTGRDSIELAKHGAEVFVLDFAENSLELVSANSREQGVHLHLIRGDAFKSPFPSESFDLIFHQGLLEHFTDPASLLRENIRLLKPGGHLLVDVPQTFHLYTVIKQILIAMDKWFAGWETQFTVRELRYLMEGCGLKIVYQYGDWMRPSLLYRILREVALKVGMEIPMYPMQGTAWQKWKDVFLDKLSTQPWAQYTQLTIGLLGQKPYR